jgi:ribosomal protein L40E
MDALVALPDDALIVEPEPEPDVEPLESLEPTALGFGGDVQVQLLDGLEATGLEERAPRARKVIAKVEDAGFQYATCPQCEAPQPTPNPPFCEACGNKLVKKKKKAEGGDEAMKRCTECGTRNPRDRGLCRNCGSRLPEE